MPRSRTSKPTPFSMVTTRFLPMSCMSPATVPISTRPRIWPPSPLASRGSSTFTAFAIARAGQQHLVDERLAGGHPLADVADRLDQSVVEDLVGRDTAVEQRLDVVADPQVVAGNDVVPDLLEVPGSVRGVRGGASATAAAATPAAAAAAGTRRLQRQPSLALDPLADPLQPENTAFAAPGRDADDDAAPRHDGPEHLVEVALEVGLAGLGSRIVDGCRPERQAVAPAAVDLGERHLVIGDGQIDSAMCIPTRGSGRAVPGSRRRSGTSAACRKRPARRRPSSATA